MLEIYWEKEKQKEKSSLILQLKTEYLYSCHLCIFLFLSYGTMLAVSLGFTAPLFRPYHGDTKSCHLSLLTNSALVHESKCGWWGRIAGSQPMSTALHITWHGAQINFGDLPPYLTYGPYAPHPPPPHPPYYSQTSRECQISFFQIAHVAVANNSVWRILLLLQQ